MSPSFGGFTLGSGFSFANGLYTAQQDGYFFASALIRLDGANGRYFRIIYRVNGQTTSVGNGGLHSIQGSPTAPYYTLHVAGTIKLTAGDKLQLVVYSNTDNAYIVQSESSLSIVRLNGVSQGFSADLAGSISIDKAGFAPLSGFSTSARPHFFNLNNAFDESTGVYTAPVYGLYWVSANIRVDDASGRYFRLIVAENPPSDGLTEADDAQNQGMLAYFQPESSVISATVFSVMCDSPYCIIIRTISCVGCCCRSLRYTVTR